MTAILWAWLGFCCCMQYGGGGHRNASGFRLPYDRAALLEVAP